MVIISDDIPNTKRYICIQTLNTSVQIGSDTDSIQNLYKLSTQLLKEIGK